MGRPSLLSLRADATGEDSTVAVGGQVVAVAEGTLL
jgi:predicted PhzF superfamily epimerase YddE/YHI9